MTADHVMPYERDQLCGVLEFCFFAIQRQIKSGKGDTQTFAIYGDGLAGYDAAVDGNVQIVRDAVNIWIALRAAAELILPAFPKVRFIIDYDGRVGRRSPSCSSYLSPCAPLC